MARRGVPRTIAPRDENWNKAKQLAEHFNIRGVDKKPSVTGVFEKLVHETYQKVFK